MCISILDMVSIVLLLKEKMCIDVNTIVPPHGDMIHHPQQKPENSHSTDPT